MPAVSSEWPALNVSAALRARLGKDPEGAEFAQLVAKLPPEDYQLLCARIEQLNGERANAECEK